MAIWPFRRQEEGETLTSTSSSGELHPIVVVVSGTTGNFGSYLLDHLLQQPWIERVICLNRSPDARARQRQLQEERGLRAEFGKVHFYQADFADARLGLNDQDYHNLASSVDLVIHNAWPVDFNRNFTSFRPSIKGVQHLIDFCLSRKQRPVKMLFVSSIGATSNWGSAAPTSRSKIPEAELTDWKVARTGYGQSKLVAERLLSHAARELNLPVAVVRVGQLSGPVLHGDHHGKWPEREWIPSLIKSSISLKALPKDLGPADDVDWVPVDVAAVVLTELCEHLIHSCRHNQRTTAEFFHLVNPRTTDWPILVRSLAPLLGEDIQLVSFIEWVALLKESASTGSGFWGVDEGINPAAKLVDFFATLQDKAVRLPKAKSTLLETKETVKVSKTLASLEAVGPDWIRMWVRQWGWGNKVA